MSSTPESAHLLMFVFGDRGVPASYRHMNGYGNHSFRYGTLFTSCPYACNVTSSPCSFVNKDGKATYAKFHVKAEGGVKNMTSDLAEAIRGADTDFLKRDMTVSNVA
jgi:catalase